VKPLRRGWSSIELTHGTVALPDRAVSELEISPGHTTDTGVLLQAVEKYQTPAARNDAGRYLQKSEHTAMQLSDYLLSRGYDTGVVEHVVRWALEYGYVDDRRYAETYVRSHTDRSPMGARRLRAELTRKGVGSDLIDEILGTRDDEELIPGLVAAVRKKYGSLDRDTAWRRASGWLSRRGFDASLIYRILTEATGGQ
jgi:regulatory protein